MSRSFTAANSARPAASSFCSDWMDPRSWTSASASRTLSASASARLSAAAAVWFVGPAACDHAALVAGTVGREESVLRVFPRQSFRRCRAIRQIRGAQPWQELFRRRTERIAELHQFVEPRDDSVFRTEIHDRLVFGGETQVPERIHKECRSAAHFITEHGNAGARVVVGLDDDIFQFVAQVLLDGGFVLFLDFGVIGQHADGMKILPATALV